MTDSYSADRAGLTARILSLDQELAEERYEALQQEQRLAEVRAELYKATLCLSGASGAFRWVYGELSGQRQDIAACMSLASDHVEAIETFLRPDYMVRKPPQREEK